MCDEPLQAVSQLCTVQSGHLEGYTCTRCLIQCQCSGAGDTFTFTVLRKDDSNQIQTLNVHVRWASSDPIVILAQKVKLIQHANKNQLSGENMLIPAWRNQSINPRVWEAACFMYHLNVLLCKSKRVEMSVCVLSAADGEEFVSVLTELLFELHVAATPDKLNKVTQTCIHLHF